MFSHSMTRPGAAGLLLALACVMAVLAYFFRFLCRSDS